MAEDLSKNAAYLPLYLIVSIAQLLSLLLYPVAGIVGEMLWTRYKVMLVGNVLVLVGLVIFPPIAYYYAAVDRQDGPNLFNVTIGPFEYSTEVVTFTSLLLYQVGMAVFEANAIQLGADQLQFGSSEDLSNFIHWYFWTTKGIYAAINLFTYYIPNATDTSVISIYQPGVQLLAALVALPVVLCCHGYLIVEPVSQTNPVKLILNVLGFARRHKRPLFRSAFTYGETSPSRLDLAKKRYGGPFTTEEVEDVKSFWRILLILVCLFGFLLARDENSSLDTRYAEKYWDIDSSISYMYGVLPASAFIIYYLIPFYQLFLRPVLRLRLPSMLKRMAVGLVCSALSLTTKAILSWILHQATADSGSCEEGSGDLNAPPFSVGLLVIPTVLKVVGEILVFLSALEFILAQAPRSMQGLLIGLWYSFHSVGVVNETASYLSALYTHYLEIYLQYTVQAALAFSSVCLFILVALCYKPRQRNEPSNVNERQIIEAYTERQLNTQAQAVYMYNENIFIE